MCISFPFMLQYRPSFLKRVVGLERKLSAAAARYGVSKAMIGLRLAALYRQRGFRPGEALAIGLADPAISKEALQGCFTKPELLALQDLLNPQELTHLTEDKDVFDTYCVARGIPVPAHLATLGRATSPAVSRLTTRKEWLQDVVPLLPTHFITKPALGVYGEGVTLWTREGVSFRDHNQQLFSAQTLYDLCCSHSKYDRFVVQKRLTNHPSLVALTGSSSLQTVRLVTLVDAADKPKCLYAEWKLVLGDNVTDNFSSGRAGNLVASVALADGAVGQAQSPAEDNVGFRRLRIHPVTGAPLEGFRLPDWSRVRELALRCARLFLPLRTIGWDIGLTPEGPVIVEGNRWWDPPNEAVIGPPAPGLREHELVSNCSLLRAAAMRNRQ